MYRNNSNFRIFEYRHVGVGPVAQVSDLNSKDKETIFISLDQLKSNGWEIISVYPEGGKLWALCRSAGERDV